MIAVRDSVPASVEAAYARNTHQNTKAVSASFDGRRHGP